MSSSITQRLLASARELSQTLSTLRFAPPIAHVYDPLQYAWAGYEAYVTRYGATRRRVVLLGMNPGPFGMMQTGVPFGEVALVRDWLGIEGEIARPAREHPKRRIEGFACARSEVSGARLWGWARARFGTPERFFARFFVWNWCPLGFLAESGANLTPDKLPAAERAGLELVCDRALRQSIEALGACVAIGVGGVAEAALRRALSEGPRVRIARALHPSPASPAANRGWVEPFERDLAAAGVELG
jgi:single-strand selective monofunctional uracil DNA glycosylase